MQSTHTKTIKIYKTATGKIPFIEWLEQLDNSTRYRIKERLDRISFGNLGDWKTVGKGVFELRLNFGSGYRIYFGQEENNIILIPSGGDKSSQKKDIKQAQKFWQDYVTR